jgi:hypothetical protein
MDDPSFVIDEASVLPSPADVKKVRVHVWVICNVTA